MKLVAWDTIRLFSSTGECAGQAGPRYDPTLRYVRYDPTLCYDPTLRSDPTLSQSLAVTI